MPDAPAVSRALSLLPLIAYALVPDLLVLLRALEANAGALAPFALGIPPLFGVLSQPSGTTMPDAPAVSRALSLLPLIAHALVLELFVMLRALCSNVHTLVPWYGAVPPFPPAMSPLFGTTIPDVPAAPYALSPIVHTPACALRPNVGALALWYGAVPPFAPTLMPLFGVLSQLPPIAHALVLELFVMLRDLRPDVHTLVPWYRAVPPFPPAMSPLFGTTMPDAPAASYALSPIVHTPAPSLSLILHAP